MPPTCPRSRRPAPGANANANANANADAAVAAAVHDVLVREVPFATALLDSEYASAIAALNGGGSMSKGILIGQRCAAAMLAMPGWELMRALALIQIAQFDAYVACLESKYFYGLWRPVSAIHLAGDDGNDATAPDAAWTSFDPVCPPVPDYPSGHSASGGAGDAALSAVFGGDATSFDHRSVTLPGPTRSFSSFSQMGNEIAASRIYVGYHFRLATTEGLAQGRKVAAQVLATQLAPRF